jgi:hypothetical protein
MDEWPVTWDNGVAGDGGPRSSRIPRAARPVWIREEETMSTPEGEVRAALDAAMRAAEESQQQGQGREIVPAGTPGPLTPGGPGRSDT